MKQFNTPSIYFTSIMRIFVFLFPLKNHGTGYGPAPLSHKGPNPYCSIASVFVHFIFSFLLLPRHTAEVESFHALRTSIYVPKQFGRCFSKQEVSGLLAVLDHNDHVSREYHRESENPYKVAWRRAFVARTSKFIARPEKERKKYR